MTNIKICPSLMCANFDNLKDEVVSLDKAGADIFHIDIMDGNFVPNFGMGLQDINTVRRNTNKEIDVHLMSINATDHIELFKNAGVDIVYVHSEGDHLISTTLAKIKENGMKVGLVVSPGTSVYSIKELLNLADIVLVMTVNPGFAGQKYLDYVDEKIFKLAELKSKYNFEIFVDGAISEEKVNYLKTKGVDGFILGTSALFGKDESYEEIIKRLKA